MCAKKFFAVFVLCWTIATAPLAHAVDKDAASTFANDLGHKALAVISDNGLSKNDQQAKLEKLFSANVDIDWIGKFVLGRNWRAATDEQKQAYLANYRLFTIRHYTSNLSDFTNSNFEVTKVRPDDNGGYVVTMRIKRPQAEDVVAEYTIREKEGDGLKVYDIAVEGVSMITTQRSEFSSVVSQKGLDYLITQLKQRAETDTTSRDN
jgi:phospholipid transport system substrate-binding protein